MKLNCVRLSKKYGSNVALKDFSHEFVPGVYGLLGPNGAGKTTLMNIMTDNLRQTTETLLYEETDIHKLGREYRRHIGYVSQQQQVFPGFTLRCFQGQHEEPRDGIQNRRQQDKDRRSTAG